MSSKPRTFPFHWRGAGERTACWRWTCRYTTWDWLLVPPSETGWTKRQIPHTHNIHNYFIWSFYFHFFFLSVSDSLLKSLLATHRRKIGLDGLFRKPLLQILQQRTHGSSQESPGHQIGGEKENNKTCHFSLYSQNFDTIHEHLHRILITSKHLYLHLCLNIRTWTRHQ